MNLKKTFAAAFCCVLLLMTVGMAFAADGVWRISSVGICRASDGKIAIPCLGAIAIDNNGYSHIAYYDNAPDARCLRYSYFDGTAWRTVCPDSQQFAGQYANIAMDSQGNPCIGYLDEDHGCIKFARYDGQDWDISFVDRDDEDEDHRVGLFLSMVLDAHDNPHFSYYDDDKEDLKYAFFDGQSWNIEVVDEEGCVGGDPSLALDSEGYPHISYHHAGRKETKYAVFDGTDWKIEVVDTRERAGGDPGRYGNLVLDKADMPHIVYMVEPERQKSDSICYARYEDGEWKFETIASDSSDSWPEKPAMVMDGSGNLHVAYYDWHRSGLWYADRSLDGWHCEMITDVRKSGEFVGLDFTGIAVDKDGLARVIGRNFSRDQVLLAIQTEMKQASLEISGNKSFLHPSAVLDGRNRQLCYYDSSDGKVHWARFDGSEWLDDPVPLPDDFVIYSENNLDFRCDEEGLPHIVFKYKNVDGVHTLNHAFFDGSEWKVEELDSDSNCYAKDPNAKVRIDGEGVPHVIYRTMDDGEIVKYLVREEDGTWDSQVIECLSGDISGNYEFVMDFVLDENGEVHMVYEDTVNKCICYARRQGDSWTKETVDTKDKGSDPQVYSVTNPAIALDGEGRPCVSYGVGLNTLDWNDTSGIRCARREGDTWRTWDVENGFREGGAMVFTSQSMSIVAGDDGLMYVSYMTSEGLNQARYDGTDWERVLVDDNKEIEGFIDETGDEGSAKITCGDFSRIAIDDDGKPSLIYSSYYKSNTTPKKTTTFCYLFPAKAEESSQPIPTEKVKDEILECFESDEGVKILGAEIISVDLGGYGTLRSEVEFDDVKEGMVCRVFARNRETVEMEPISEIQPNVSGSLHEAAASSGAVTVPITYADGSVYDYDDAPGKVTYTLAKVVAPSDNALGEQDDSDNITGGGSGGGCSVASFLPASLMLLGPLVLLLKRDR